MLPTILTFVLFSLWKTDSSISSELSSCKIVFMCRTLTFSLFRVVFVRIGVNFLLTPENWQCWILQGVVFVNRIPLCCKRVRFLFPTMVIYQSAGKITQNRLKRYTGYRSDPTWILSTPVSNKLTNCCLVCRGRLDRFDSGGRRLLNTSRWGWSWGSITIKKWKF